MQLWKPGVPVSVDAIIGALVNGDSCSLSDALVDRVVLEAMVPAESALAAAASVGRPVLSSLMAPAESAPAAAPSGGLHSSLGAPAETAPAAAPPGGPRLLSSLPVESAPAAVLLGGRPVAREKPPGFWSWSALSGT